ncbi:hypothetical protein Vqi01_42920 [Micromonospora qiuiae]|uniref:Uncharacterized protein n=1 Tax=Micromonospora qiuiae TaxID=502268 RepID=A0ABQ4JI54_9ACTN|nr:hypothetical protein [Micromonospora qiuiae]GIJ29130.1 hypothetical protein Vqi01_42920 [Micromonospora qiuiae]
MAASRRSTAAAVSSAGGVIRAASTAMTASAATVACTARFQHLFQPGRLITAVVRAAQRCPQAGDRCGQSPGPPVRQCEALEGDPDRGGIVGVLMVIDVVAIELGRAECQLGGDGVAFRGGDQQSAQVQRVLLWHAGGDVDVLAEGCQHVDELLHRRGRAGQRGGAGTR